MAIPVLGGGGVAGRGLYSAGAEDWEKIAETGPGTLPIGQNSPQKCKYDLYAEGVG
ncbi:hypothetical protein PHLCEN_2v9987 [Hermanssonia centrifuga]|uniref:Homogentisate 1,2-dioxygenase N-terminal domain-containing protein n=1 Tax=Hermanssonia centrifuga TaxID=98765 RepID=A0A2R6NP69_9APHY|nr:hypothetical protein PHLCEN_2v9987 [Hermanssonia centrifuga]